MGEFLKKSSLKFQGPLNDETSVNDGNQIEMVLR